MIQSRLIHLTFTLALLLATACSESGGTDVTGPEQPTDRGTPVGALAANVTLKDTVLVGSTDTLIVKLTAKDGSAIQGATIEWSASQGSVSSSTSTTDAAGLARTLWTRSTTTGRQTASATLRENDVVAGANLVSPVSFSVTAAEKPKMSLSVVALAGLKHALGINDNGVVAGNLAGTSSMIPAVWSNGAATRLPLPQNYSQAMIDGISNTGAVVGDLHFSQIGFGFGAVWVNGNVIETGRSTAIPSFNPDAINDSLVVVGRGTDTARVDFAMAWKNGVYTDLGAGPRSYATGINNRGQIVGNGDGFRFIWQNGSLVRLPDFGQYAFADAISESGLVAGHGKNSDGTHHLLIWQNGLVRSLATFPDEPRAVAINDQGHILGNTYKADGTLIAPFLWDGSKILWLNDHATGWTIRGVTDWNRNGQIVGTARRTGSTDLVGVRIDQGL